MLFATCILALILYLFAPSTYEWGYCQMCHLLFLAIATYVYIKDYKIEKLGFHLIFSISFYFTNFVYPIFVYPIDPEYVLFRFFFDTSVITKSTALALFAYSLYAVGYMWNYRKNSSNLQFPHRNNEISPSAAKILVCVTTLLFVCFLLANGLEYYKSQYQEGVNVDVNPFVRYIIVLLNPLLVLTCLTGYYITHERLRKLIFCIVVTLATIILFAGSRTLPLSLYILIFLYYVRKKRLSIITISLLLCLGVVSMSLIGELRSEEIYDIALVDTADKQWYDYAMDLIINNRNLYVLFEYVQSNGCLWGVSMLAPILSVLPLLQSSVMSFFSIPEYMMSSSQFTTYMEFGANPPIGLGTNVVGDVYLAFGLLGVMLLFPLLGHFVSIMRKHALHGSLICGMVYYIMAADAIYLCRSYYFLSFKTIVWVVFFVYIITRLNKS